MVLHDLAYSTQTHSLNKHLFSFFNDGRHILNERCWKNVTGAWLFVLFSLCVSTLAVWFWHAEPSWSACTLDKVWNPPPEPLAGFPWHHLGPGTFWGAEPLVLEPLLRGTWTLQTIIFAHINGMFPYIVWVVWIIKAFWTLAGAFLCLTCIHILSLQWI